MTKVTRQQRTQFHIRWHPVFPALPLSWCRCCCWCCCCCWCRQHSCGLVTRLPCHKQQHNNDSVGHIIVYALRQHYHGVDRQAAWQPERDSMWELAHSWVKNETGDATPKHSPMPHTLCGAATKASLRISSRNLLIFARLFQFQTKNRIKAT